MTERVTLPNTNMPAPERPPPRVISRRIAFSFGAVALVVVVMCGVLIYSIADIANSVRSMQEDEVLVRASLGLAMAVREQYIHQAHVIIDGDEHLTHYREWVARVRTDAKSLRARIEPKERWRVDHVVAQSTDLDRLFRTEISAALQRDERAKVRSLHRDAETLSSRAVEGADTIAAMMEQRMNRRHEHAVSSAKLGFGAGGIGMLLVVVLSVASTVRIRRSVLAPLDALSATAQQIGQGDFDVRLGNVGEGELRSVAGAVDRMAEELRVRERRLVETERMAVVGQLAAGVAHEINNPIGVIRGYLRTIDANELPAAIAEELRIIDDEAAACQRIAEDLVAFSRAGDLALESVPVHELLERSARRFENSGEADAHRIELDLAAGIVEADPGRLRQVVLNLLKNAVRATPAGSAIEIEGAPTESGGYGFRVHDRGDGVPPSDAARIFEPFYSKHGSSGLGLAVCHGIVAAHGGSITVEPRAGGGATFHVELLSRAKKSES